MATCSHRFNGEIFSPLIEKWKYIVEDEKARELWYSPNRYKGVYRLRDYTKVERKEIFDKMYNFKWSQKPMKKKQMIKDELWEI